MKKNKILGVLSVIFLSSCSIFTIEKNNFDCKEIDHEIELKKSLFKKLSKKELNKTEIKELFNEDNLINHIDYSVKELSRGNPFKKFDKKYYFYFKSASLE